MKTAPMTTPKAEHSPLPWKLESHGINEPEYGHGIVFSSGGAHRFVNLVGIGKLETVEMDTPRLEANAELIVRCVNSHDELVAALEKLARAADDYLKRPAVYVGDSADLRDCVDASIELLTKSKGTV